MALYYLQLQIGILFYELDCIRVGASIFLCGPFQVFCPIKFPFCIVDLIAFRSTSAKRVVKSHFTLLVSHHDMSRAGEMISYGGLSPGIKEAAHLRRGNQTDSGREFLSTRDSTIRIGSREERVRSGKDFTGFQTIYL
jgi:hypothetical protein